MTLRVGIVCSSGGGVFRVGRKLLDACGQKHEFSVVTDRPCEIEAACSAEGIPQRRIVESDRASFSDAAFKWLVKDRRVDMVCLFFVRSIGIELLRHVPCFNIHPSLLPAFPGFNAIKQAQNHGARFIGATLHLATEEIDAGPMIAQTTSPVPIGASEEYLKSLSYAQKLYLFLLLLELWSAGSIRITSNNTGCDVLSPPGGALAGANPSLYDPRLNKAYFDFIANEGIHWHP